MVYASQKKEEIKLLFQFLSSMCRLFYQKVSKVIIWKYKKIDPVKSREKDCFNYILPKRLLSRLIKDIIAKKLRIFKYSRTSLAFSMVN